MALAKAAVGSAAGRTAAGSAEADSAEAIAVAATKVAQRIRTQAHAAHWNATRSCLGATRRTVSGAHSPTRHAPESELSVDIACAAASWQGHECAKFQKLRVGTSYSTGRAGLLSYGRRHEEPFVGCLKS